MELVKLSLISEVVYSWGRKSTGPGEFDVANAKTTDDLDWVFGVDFFNDRTQAFDAWGELLFEAGSQSSDASKFDKPTDMAVAGRFAYAVDFGNNRIQKFSLLA